MLTRRENIPPNSVEFIVQCRAPDPSSGIVGHRFAQSYLYQFPADFADPLHHLGIKRPLLLKLYPAVFTYFPIRMNIPR